MDVVVFDSFHCICPMQDTHWKTCERLMICYTLFWMKLSVYRRRKERTYPELIGGRRCRLMVLGIERGGRWSQTTGPSESTTSPTAFANIPSSSPHLPMDRFAQPCRHARLRGRLARPRDCSNHANVEGNQPTLSQVLAEAPLHATAPSRLPARS